jgi:hypothetical protein
MPFPTKVNVQPAPGVAGDFASGNPRSTVLSAAGAAFVAGSNGVTVGRFAWTDSTNTYLGNAGVGVPTGFIHRDQPALITTYLSEYGMSVPAGFPVTAFSAGDFWVVNSGTATSVVGNKAYANPASGLISFAATGTPTAGATVTGANQTIVTNTATCRTANNTATIGISGVVMTVSAVGTGTVLAVGQTVTGTGIAAGTTIVNQLTGTAGSTGTYTVAVSQYVASSTAATMSGGGLTVATMTSGYFYVGQVISGAGLATGSVIAAVGTGTGTNTGTYAVSVAPTTPTASGTVTGAGSYLVATTGVSGTVNQYDVVTDTSTAGNVTAGTYIALIVAQTSTTLSAVLSNSVAAATTDNLSIASNIETKWYAGSVGAPGELVIMTSWPLG